MTITIADGRGALWQWDTGRRLRVGSGVEQIHYQNKCFGRSVDVDVGDDGTAIIPDELLQDWHPLTAYAYVTDDTGAYTMVQQDFAVHKRAKPAGYVYTPTDQMTLQMIQRQIGDLTDLTTEAKENLVAAINEVARTGGGAGNMDLRVADGYIQYSTDGGSTWQNLIAVADLKGGKGDPGAAGQNGHSPVVTATKSGKATTISVDGAAIATIEDGADGAPGKDGADGKPGAAGADGITPTIGSNGNWYLGETDTGKPSRGAAGTPGKDGAGMDITGATIGQIAKITAVDSDGKPTAWSPADMPSGGGSDLQWFEVADITTEEQTQKLTISVDKDGRPISQYNALWMIFSILFPADATQTSTNGTPWIYPFPKTGDNAYRFIATVSGWKTTERTLTYAWTGLPRIPWSSSVATQMTFGTDGDPDFLSGLCVFLNSSGDHVPAGTRVRIAVLSKGVTA